ncbi:MFS transporter [Actinomadura alba]|uniref:MFS transporter n=1 Tax=Actinomadura alba TaxID=406431 RepID=A0ABR7LQZ7_9ACTN|nr:MFS transporter [Actinomadura alba]MBC6467270.1 MFS transporter [Actinomadura alba]
MAEQLTRFIASRTVSIFGDRIADLALPLAIISVTGSASKAGVVAATLQAPRVLAALHAGALVDRVPRRKLMIGADLIQGLAYIVIGLEISVGGARWIPLVMVALIAGMAETVFSLAAASYLPQIVAKERLVRANGWLEAADAGATLTGPAVGGMLLQRLGTMPALAFNSCSFLVSAILLRRLPDTRPRGPRHEAGLLLGARLLLSRTDQLALLVGSVYMQLLASCALLVFFVRAKDDLDLASGVIGLVASAAGVGGLASSLIIARLVERRPWWMVLAIALTVNAVGVGLLGVFTHIVLLAAAVAVLDGASALCFIIASATRQRITPGEAIGRLTAASGAITSTVRVLAVAGIGVLVDAFSASTTLFGLALIGAPFILAVTAYGSIVSRQRTHATATAAKESQ